MSRLRLAILQTIILRLYIICSLPDPVKSFAPPFWKIFLCPPAQAAPLPRAVPQRRAPPPPAAPNAWDAVPVRPVRARGAQYQVLRSGLLLRLRKPELYLGAPSVLQRRDAIFPLQPPGQLPPLLTGPDHQMADPGSQGAGRVKEAPVHPAAQKRPRWPQSPGLHVPPDRPQPAGQPWSGRAPPGPPPASRSRAKDPRTGSPAG